MSLSEECLGSMLWRSMSRMSIRGWMKGVGWDLLLDSWGFLEVDVDLMV